MARTVEYCLRNVDAETRRRLEESDCETVGKRCLQRCGDCYRGEFLVVDGAPEFGDDHADVLPAVLRR
ncbi:MAG: DUF1450 domain-containing protein [Halobacteriaceae archaeon]